MALPEPVVVIDVESPSVPAAKPRIRRQTTHRPRSTIKPFVQMGLLDSGNLDAKQRLICKRPLPIGECSHTLEVISLNADNAIAYSCNSNVAEASAANCPPTHGIFVGYAPADRPDIAMLVCIA